MMNRDRSAINNGQITLTSDKMGPDHLTMAGRVVAAMCLIGIIWIRETKAEPSPFLDSVVLPVEQSHDGLYYTNIVVGNPGRYLRFLLDFTTNDTVIELPLNRFSQTFSVYEDESQGSEIFYFRHLKLRLPVHYNPLAATSVHQGVLALGPGSWLWRWWSEYTIVPSSLYLGEYGTWSREDLNFYAPLLHAEHVVGQVDGSDYHVDLHSGTPLTFLPNQLYIKENISIIVQGGCEDAYRECNVNPGSLGYCYDSWALDFHSEDYTIQDPITGFMYKALHRSEDAEEISLGVHVTSDMFFYHNLLQGLVTMQPSYRAFSRQMFNLVSSLVLFTLLVLWLSMVLVRRIESEHQRLLVICVQVYGHVFALVVWVMNTVGLRNTRLLLHHYHWHGFWVQGIFVGVFLATTIGTAVLIWRSFERLPNPFVVSVVEYTHSWQVRRWFDTLPLQRLFFETAIMLALWVSLLETNYSTFDFVITVFVSTIHSILVTILALDVWIERGWGTTLVLCLVTLVLSYGFLVGFNLSLVVYTLWFWHPTWPAVFLFYIMGFVVMPSLHIFVKKRIHSLDKLA